MFLKRLTVPESNATKEVDVAQLWEVRWTGLRFGYVGESYPDPRPEVETFLSEREAKDFVKSLEAARRLLRITGMTGVSLEKAK